MLKLTLRLLRTALLAASLIWVPAASAREWMDRSSSIFFPPKFQKQIEATQVFPAFWWNFLVLDGVKPGDTERMALAQSTCAELKKQTTELAQIECEPEASEFAKLLTDWSRDLPLRTQYENLRPLNDHFNAVLAQASLLPGSSGMLDLFRMDPFETWKTLKERAEKQLPPLGDKLQGFFYHAETARILIPIQFSFPPDQTERTRSVLGHATGFSLIGPHGSTLENQTRIIDDLHGVSLVGLFVLALFAAWLAYARAYRLLPLFAVIGIGTGIGFLCTWLVFGSVHGLTLSLGSAICGLAMDYAFQAALNSHEPKIWKSNLCGLSTTLIGLVVLMFSSMPLLRQMMFFSASGLIGSFALCYFVFRKKAAWFHTRLFHYEPAPRPAKLGMIGVLLVLACFGAVSLNPNLNLKQFDYQNAHDREIALWLYTKLGMKAPLFEIHGTQNLQALSQTEKSWAEAHHIGIETLANYLPPAEVQSQNLKTWDQFPADFQAAPKNAQIFFAPFTQNHANKPFSPETDAPRAYLAHLNHGPEWLSVWLPKTDAEESSIRAAFPNSNSLGEVITEFPKTLAQELRWMAPISILLALLFHYVYYRRLSYSLVALLPFFSGFGLITLARLVLHFDLSFISVIGLILVFGFSLDYGIFATDASLYPERRGMWPGIMLAAFSTIAGFVPLVFCLHPVLKDLGTTLLFGGVGTFLGALFAIPEVMALLKRSENNA